MTLRSLTTRTLGLAAIALALVASPASAASTTPSPSAAIQRVDPAMLRNALAQQTADAPGAAAGASIPSSAGGGNTVTLQIVMPADAAMPGDPGCDPSYPQLCVPLGAPDLDCEGMGVAGFVVLAPDVHRLDEDGDGLGCED